MLDLAPETEEIDLPDDFSYGDAVLAAAAASRSFKDARSWHFSIDRISLGPDFWSVRTGFPGPKPALEARPGDRKHY